MLRSKSSSSSRINSFTYAGTGVLNCKSILYFLATDSRDLSSRGIVSLSNFSLGAPKIGLKIRKENYFGGYMKY